MSREEAFPGKLMDTAPDLYLELADHGFVSIRNIEPIVDRRPDVTGTHRPNGIFFASGPGISRDAPVVELSVVDVAPLVLHSLGTPIPDEMDGCVRDEVFDPRWLARNPPVVAVDEPADGEAWLAQRWEQEISHEDDAGVLKRLADLGYVELDE
jgi:hypothetical protein